VVALVASRIEGDEVKNFPGIGALCLIFNVNQGLLPDLVGIPLVIQDKSFVAQNILARDPTWQWGMPGDLWYRHVYEANIPSGGVPNPKGRWDWGPP
jgi:hypothetical protein